MNYDGTPKLDSLAQGIGARIRDIRRQRHITQGELARRVGIRPGPMNMLEKGRHVPSGRVLIRLAEVLGVKMDDFVVPVVPERQAGMVRESEDLPIYGYAPRLALPLLPLLDTTCPSHVADSVNEVARSFLALEDLCHAMKAALVPLHIPFQATESGIEQLVVQVRHQLGVTNAVVFDYLELMENAGLRVVFCRLPAEVPSLSGYDQPNGNAFFFIGQRMTVERQLFRLVFELGRVYWHTRRLYGSGRRSVPGELDELHTARKFAALFLMPASTVRATVAQLGVEPGAWTYELLLRIKHRFGVSAESFCIRLEELTLIDESLAGLFKERIRAYYRDHRNAEPDGSRRRLTHNGRLGDLLLTAAGRASSRGEARSIAQTLRKHGVRSVAPKGDE